MSAARTEARLNDKPVVDAILRKLTHAKGPISGVLVIEVINWLARREVQHRSPAADLPVGNVGVVAHGDFACPYCGYDKPHYHSPADLDALRTLKGERARFEAFISKFLQQQNVRQFVQTRTTWDFARPAIVPTDTYFDPAVEILWVLWKEAANV